MEDSRQVVRRQLWELRREPGMLEEARLAGKTHLVHCLAAGDPYLAFEYLKDMASNFPGDREVAMAIRSLGVNVEDDHTNTEKRLESAGKALGYEKRHARRLSDAGIEKLVSFILDGMFGAGPIIGITLRQSGTWEFLTRVHFYLPQGSKIKIIRVQYGEDGEMHKLDLKRLPKQPDEVYTCFESPVKVHSVPPVIMTTRLISVFAIPMSPASYDVNSRVDSEFAVAAKSNRYNCTVFVSRDSR